ncbi:hypothetical protein XH96_04720 [Bradyrhizobium sp. CCBAU 51765]|nr:hypothetical protein XH96_04720 [Bradyrhizobium sp. CCBAU 51765]
MAFPRPASTARYANQRPIRSPEELDARCELAPPFPLRSASNEVSGCLPGSAIVDPAKLDFELVIDARA